MTGTVKWFNTKKGFGFILAPEETTEDIFVHYSAINKNGFKTLDEGAKVEFELFRSPKGNQARNVTEVKDNEANININKSL